MKKIQEEDFEGDGSLGLLSITYEDAGKFSTVDQVMVWIDGGLFDS